jgi:hypothetical protein
MRMGNVDSMLRVKLRLITAEPTLLLNLLTEQLDWPLHLSLSNSLPQVLLQKTNLPRSSRAINPQLLVKLRTMGRLNLSTLTRRHSINNHSMVNPQSMLSLTNSDKWEWVRNNSNSTQPISSLHPRNHATSNTPLLKFVYHPILVYRPHPPQMPISATADLPLTRSQRRHRC